MPAAKPWSSQHGPTKDPTLLLPPPGVFVPGTPRQTGSGSRQHPGGVTSMRRRLATLRRIPMPLRILLAIALVELLAWTIAMAPFQGPDENNHFAYAQQLAETGGKPSFGSG